MLLLWVESRLRLVCEAKTIDSCRSEGVRAFACVSGGGGGWLLRGRCGQGRGRSYLVAHGMGRVSTREGRYARETVGMHLKGQDSLYRLDLDKRPLWIQLR